MYSTVLGVLWAILPAIAGTYLLLDLGRIAGMLQVDPLLGFWGYVAVFAVSAGLGILPTYSQSILGGWGFGFGYGLVGALMGFVVAPRLATSWRVPFLGDRSSTWSRAIHVHT